MTARQDGPSPLEHGEALRSLKFWKVQKPDLDAIAPEQVAQEIADLEDEEFLWCYAAATAVAVMTGTPDIIHEPVNRVGPVLVICADWRSSFFTKRVAALLNHHEIAAREIEGRLYIVAPPHPELVLARRESEVVRFTRAADNIVTRTRQLGIVHILVEPVAVFQDLNEVSTEEAQRLRYIAESADASMHVLVPPRTLCLYGNRNP